MTLEVLEVSRPQAVHTNMLGRETVQVCECVCVCIAKSLNTPIWGKKEMSIYHMD